PSPARSADARRPGLPMKATRAPRRCGCISGRPRYSRGWGRQGRPARKGRRAGEAGAPTTQGCPMLHVHNPAPTRPGADRLTYAREIVRAEAAALEQVAQRLDDSFLEAVALLLRCPGRVAITGTGKSADVGGKIAGTLNSTGTRAYVLDATRAVHGDLAIVHPTHVPLV